MRNISFAMTIPQFLDGTKDVTRRLGWRSLKAGTRLMGCEKCMGLRPGERIAQLGEIEVIAVRRERLDAITAEDCSREGFPGMTPEEFVEMFCLAMRCTVDTIITRIEFRRVAECARLAS